MSGKCLKIRIFIFGPNGHSVKSMAYIHHMIYKLVAVTQKVICLSLIIMSAICSLQDNILNFPVQYDFIIRTSNAVPITNLLNLKIRETQRDIMCFYFVNCVIFSMLISPWERTCAYI
jgi:hypothetical protein